MSDTVWSFEAHHIVLLCAIDDFWADRSIRFQANIMQYVIYLFCSGMIYRWKLSTPLFLKLGSHSLYYTHVHSNYIERKKWHSTKRQSLFSENLKPTYLDLKLNCMQMKTLAPVRYLYSKFWLSGCDLRYDYQGLKQFQLELQECTSSYHFKKVEKNNKLRIFFNNSQFRAFNNVNWPPKSWLRGYDHRKVGRPTPYKSWPINLI